MSLIVITVNLEKTVEANLINLVKRVNREKVIWKTDGKTMLIRDNGMSAESYGELAYDLVFAGPVTLEIQTNSGDWLS